MPDILNQLTADEIFDRLESVSPEVARFRAKDREKIDKQRVAAAAAIAAVEAEYLPKLEAAAVEKKQAEAETERLRKSHQSAVASAFAASQNLFSLDATKRNLVGQQEKILRQTCDPRIGRLYREISEAMSKPFGNVSFGAEAALPASNYEAKRNRTDWEKRVAHVEIQRAALRELDVLELEALDAAELSKRLASIRSRALPTNGHSIKL